MKKFQVLHTIDDLGTHSCIVETMLNNGWTIVASGQYVVQYQSWKQDNGIVIYDSTTTYYTHFTKEE